MARQAQLEPHLTSEELRQRYRSSGSGIEARRYQLLWLISQEKSIKEASEMVTLSYRYARYVVQRYNRAGPEGIRNRHKEKRPKGPSRLLSAEQEAELRQALQGPASDRGKWTSRKVAQWMSEQLGRKVAVQRGWDYLKRLDMVRRKPRPRHVKADESEQRAFKKR